MSAEVRYCPYCGQAVQPFYSFCPHCGMSMSMPTVVVPPPKRERERAYDYFAEHRVMLVLLAFLVGVVVMLIVAIPPAPPSVVSQYNSTLASLNTIRNETTLNRAFTIAEHNLVIATGEIVPVFGVFLYGLSTYVTGLTGSVEAAAYGLNISGFFVLLTLFLYPDTWLELPAYSIAVVQGLALIMGAIGGRGPLKKELTMTAYVWAFILVELVVAALFESAAISLQNVGTFDFVVLWIPFAVVMYGSYRFLKWRGVLGRKSLRPQPPSQPPPPGFPPATQSGSGPQPFSNQGNDSGA